jgi:hypothetical protein
VEGAGLSGLAGIVNAALHSRAFAMEGVFNVIGHGRVADCNTVGGNCCQRAAGGGGVLVEDTVIDENLVVCLGGDSTTFAN